ncbi:hypothetical protein [Psychrobium sp. 1_MG-2023]|uniref:hypothetical protein n=1 Tax=Psychrobium sp. 1_MG-2023 TaxID=3062624 RepID=UPI000C3202F5|nr:hypothetical protein [Psychrobium sp. 1_MG-2023]MDP2562672.1 hypothetical protein [Psychrobium sp. 1_MG-2023]PKF53799.1 hypothetical protein CW748_17505 [Alteromonadales bacterium alter-6D02]
MKVIHYILAISIAPLIPFGFYFSQHEMSFSNNQIDWGAFGSFMGGVSGPVVAAITLMFLIQSFRQQSKVSSIQVYLTLLKDHVDYVLNYKTQYSGGYEGIEYLDYLWKQTSIFDDDITEINIKSRFENNIAQIQPLVENFKFVLKQISKDQYLSVDEKNRFITLYYSRLTSVEIKLFLSVAIVDTELHVLLSKYKYDLHISKPKTEDALVDFLKRRIET